MRLRTLHSHSGAPELLMALYECAECGYERRQPLEVATALETEVA